MNNTKFTKGKWQIYINEANSFEIEAEDCYLAEIYTSCERCDDIEAQANANLIKTAPEMYEMLLEILESEELPYCNSDISKLLAKARGESNE
jgi:hypothetical protein